jgi:hypothetical protein
MLSGLLDARPSAYSFGMWIGLTSVTILSIVVCYSLGYWGICLLEYLLGPTKR